MREFVELSGPVAPNELLTDAPLVPFPWKVELVTVGIVSLAIFSLGFTTMFVLIMTFGFFSLVANVTTAYEFALTEGLLALLLLLFSDMAIEESW